MKRQKYYIFLTIVVIVFTILFSYLIFINGTTKKVMANVNNFAAYIDDESSYGDYPVIASIINSSGENLVNTDVALTINVKSRYKIKNIKYSFDMKKWYNINKDFNHENVTVSLVFNKTMDKKIYIKAENDRGYESYAYKTVVKIDKEKPRLKVFKDMNDIIIQTSDNEELSKIQFSYNKINWVNMDISGEEVYLRKKDFNYLYVRVVDKIGNISEIKKIAKK